MFHFLSFLCYNVITILYEHNVSPDKIAPFSQWVTTYGDKIGGFIAFWEFPDFGFVEHLAVESDLRGSGIGAELLSSFQREYKGPIFLEVEPPLNDLNKRRIQVYNVSE